MLRTRRLKKNYEFSLVFRKGSFVGAKNVNLNYRRNRLSYNRLGVTSSRKTENAVLRNHTKRLLREAYRRLEPEMKTGFDLVFLGKPHSGKLQFEDVLRDMRYLLRKAHLLDDSLLAATARQDDIIDRDKTIES